MARFRAVAGEVNRRGVADAFHTSHSAGTANGWNEAMQWVESLSRSARVTAEKPSSQVNETGTDMEAVRRAELYELLAP